MADRRQWVKLWATWYTTASHLGVGAMALHVGAVLMTCVQWAPGEDEDTAWAELETGMPLSIEAIAHRAQANPRDVAKAIEALRSRGTLVRRDDGAWGFPRFGRWQETPDASRKRKATESLREDTSRRTYVYFARDARGLCKIGFSSNPWARVRDLRQTGAVGAVELLAKIVGDMADEKAHHARFAELRETGEWFRYVDPLRSYVESLRSTTVVDDGSSTKEAEAEAEAEQAPPTPASGGRPTSRRGASPRPTPQADPRIDAVLERVDQHRERLGLTALAPSARTPATIAARLKSGATLDELLAVVDAFGRLADREPDKRTVLCATTPFTGPSGSRPGGWAWGLRLLDEERGRPTGRGGAPARIGPALRSVDDVLADRDREVPA